MPAVRTITNPVYGYIADRIRNKKKISLFTSTVSAFILLMFSLPFVKNNGFWAIYIVSIGISLFSDSGAIIDTYALDVLGKNDK